ncbi:hypothetical protein HDE_14162 [Halotydeus destructor]|nr:hypothetical protein HDE_14162 [Halotydeus destructor]
MDWKLRHIANLNTDSSCWKKSLNVKMNLSPPIPRWPRLASSSTFLDSENPDDLKDVATAHELACDEKHKEKWPLFGSCLKEAQVKSGKPMTKKQVWDKIKDCVGLDEAPLF